MKTKNRVLIVATSRKTRGGITAVLKAYESTRMWKDLNCIWIETHIDTNRFLSLLYFFKAVAVFLFKINTADIVHIHTSAYISAMRKSPFVFITKLFRKKLVIHLHTSPEYSFLSSKKFLFIYKYIFSQADKIIVLSEGSKQLITKHFGNKNIEVIYNPIIKINSTNINKSNIILFLGAVLPRKGYLDLINAFAKIADKHHDWKLIISGVGDIDYGQNMVRNLRMDKQIFFTGWVSGKEKECYLGKSSIFCLPSYIEGFPMAVLDALAYGIPVITTPVGGIVDIAKDNENMLLFNPGDVDYLSYILERMINDKDLRVKLSKESFNMAKTIFHIDNIETQLRSIYDSLI